MKPSVMQFLAAALVLGLVTTVVVAQAARLT